MNSEVSKSNKKGMVDKILDDSRAECRVSCKCGHTMLITSKMPHIYCSNCDRKVYNNFESGKKERFRDEFYKAKRRLKNEEK